MKANSPTPTSQDRPAPTRRRASRAFGPSSWTLEGRELLSSSGVTSLSLGAPADIGPVSVTTTALPLPPDPSGTSDGVGDPPAGGIATGPGSAPLIPPDHQPPPGKWPPSHGQWSLRLALAEADVQVDGQRTSEFALSIPARGIVLVKVGLEGPLTVLSSADGISHPGQVVLKDINGDGIPDLLVANTGRNNLLIFPGLPDGGVGRELNGGNGFAVGQRPTGITVGDINTDGSRDIIVANLESNNVSILLGQGIGANWTLVPGQTLATGTSPVRTVVQDINHDGKPDLFVLNSGSNNVTMYQGLGDGTFATESLARFAVGLAPDEMFIGRFDHRPGLDLVTVNSGSNDVSFIAGITSGAPQTMTFTSGGSQPDAAFPVDLNHDGVLDLVVANGGDGRLALLQGASTGLQFAGVITSPGLPAATALAPDFATGARFDFFAASAGQDAAQLLQFDLGPASAFLSVPLNSSSSLDATESELIAQLLPFGESDLELIAVLWESDRGSRIKPSDLEGHEVALSPVPYAKTSLDEDAEGELAGAPADPAPIAFPPEDPASWVRYVIGTNLALAEPRDLLHTLAPMDDEANDPRPPVLPLPERPAIDPDLEAATDAIDEALRSLRSEGPAPTAPAPIENLDRVGLDTGDGPPREVCARSIPVVASSILFASRLILKASPPRPPSIRRGIGKRLDVTGPRRDRPTRL